MTASLQSYEREFEEREFEEREFERLYTRLLHQQDGAFFMVTANASLQFHVEIAERMCRRFDEGIAQIIDFREVGIGYRFSVDFLCSPIKNDTKYIFLANFHLACGHDMTDTEFFQILNVSRDTLAELPVVFVFMTPLYFRIEIAQKAPDFNSFFGFMIDFPDEKAKPASVMLDMPEPYSESKRELLYYYQEKYNSLSGHENRQAFDTLVRILSLNAFVWALPSIEANRFFEAFERLLPQYEGDFGSGPDSMADIEDIANIYNGKGDYANALNWLRKALAIREKSFGKEHPDTAPTYNNIALAYRYQNDYASALEWYGKALAVYEKSLGKDHPKTATTYNNIGIVFERQGDYANALKWHRKALAIREKSLGKWHTDTAESYNDIAAVYDDQGEHSKALELYGKALAIYEKEFGKWHPKTASTHHNIALAYHRQGDYTRAIEWYEEALVAAEKTLGKKHPNTAGTYFNIATVYAEIGDYAESLKWYEKALPIFEESLGKDHPYTQTTYNNITAIKSHTDT